MMNAHHFRKADHERGTIRYKFEIDGDEVSRDQAVEIWLAIVKKVNDFRADKELPRPDHVVNNGIIQEIP